VAGLSGVIAKLDRAEGVRLAHDLHLTVVGPLDGLGPKTLEGGQLAVIIGAG